jgi:CRP/FNR family transcriptional regulator
MPLIDCNCDGCELKDLFFENVNTSEIEKICSRKTERSFKKGETIIKEGNEIKEFKYMKSGLVKLTRLASDGKDQIICFAGPFDFVSLLSIFSAPNYNYSVTALEDSEVCCLSLEEVKEMATLNGKFSLSLIEKVNHATDNIILTFLEVKQKRLFGRIAYILLFFADEIYKNNVFELPVSRKEIAEFIGMTTENVIRTMSELRKDNIIRISGKIIEIIDKERLIKIREFS